MPCFPESRALLLSSLLIASQAFAQDPSYTQFGTGCAGKLGIPLLEAYTDSRPIFGGTFRAMLSNVPDGLAIGILGRSTSTWAGFPILPLDLGIIAMPGCTLYTDLRQTTILTIEGGTAIWATSLPSEPEFLGQSFYQQAFVLDDSVPGLGAVMSNANAGIIGAADPGAPVATIAFPPPNSMTIEGTILVRGTASDPDGIAEVRVNERLATTSDGFANWQLRLPIVEGGNTLAIETIDTKGDRNPRAAEAEIEYRVFFDEPEDLVVDLPRNRVLVTENSRIAILNVDLDTGERTVFSDDTIGSGPEFLGSIGGFAIHGSRAIVVDRGGRLSSGGNIRPPAVFSVNLINGDRSIISMGPRIGWVGLGTGPGFDSPRSLALDDSRALVMDSALNALLAVDLATGNRTVISDDSRGTGPSFFSPLGLALDGVRALVLDRTGVIAVDLATGDRKVLASATIGTGPVLKGAQRIALDGSRALVTDRFLEAVIAVDLTTGDRTVLSDESHGAGTGRVFDDPRGIAVDGSTALVVDRSVSRSAILAVDLATGDRTSLSDNNLGAGPVFNSPDGVATDGSSALVVDGGLGGLFGFPGNPPAVIAVNLDTGDRSVISGERNGTGPSFSLPYGIAMDGSRALLTDSILNAVIAVDLATGDRTLLSSASTGTGPGFSFPLGIVLDGTRALVVDSQLGSILAVNLTTGDRSVFSDESSGTGPVFFRPRNIVLDGARALLVDTFLSAVFAIDLATGDRTVLSDRFNGTGPDLLRPRGLVLVESRALVVDSQLPAVFAIDLATGDRTLISDHNTGRGPVLDEPFGIALDGARAMVVDFGLKAILAVDSLTGERVFRSR